MKKAFLIFVFLLPLVFMAQRRPKIKGNRVVTEVADKLPTFNAIILEDDLPIVLEKSFGEGFRIKADDNLVDIIKFEVVDGTLIISSYYDIISKKTLEIAINYVDLKAITLKQGNLRINESLAMETLEVNTFGNSQLNLTAKGFLAYVNAENSSKLDLNLDLDSLAVTMNDKADARIYAVSGALSTTVTDNAGLTLEGSAENAQLQLTGNSKLNADVFESADTNLSIAEAAFARVNAYRTFSLSSKDTAKIFLYGNPKITIEEFSGSSQLFKKGD